jgi:hypothetical protein
MMVNPEQQNDKVSVDEYEIEFEADNGFSSKRLDGESLKGVKGKSGPEVSEVRDQPENSEEKPRVEYIEDVRTPYWDTQNVVGALRDVSSEKSSSEKIPARPGFFRRRWQHYRRYWILYTVAAVILLAILLPIA